MSFDGRTISYQGLFNGTLTAALNPGDSIVKSPDADITNSYEALTIFRLILGGFQSPLLKISAAGNLIEVSNNSNEFNASSAITFAGDNDIRLYDRIDNLPSFQRVSVSSETIADTDFTARDVTFDANNIRLNLDDVTIAPGESITLRTIVAGETPAVLDLAPLNAVRAEGDGGTTPFTFTVTRGGDLSAAVGASWAVAGPDAVADDFAGGVLPSGTVSFAAGDDTETVTVKVRGDIAIEGNERFQIALSAPSGGATLGTNTATGTIRDDDANVRILGTAANNRLEGRSIPEHIEGRGGDDLLFGRGGGDDLLGGDGRDQLAGDGGRDFLLGGKAADRFVFRAPGDSTPGQFDTILDYTRGQGDLIDLLQLDAVPGRAGDQDFRFVGETPFSGVGQVRFHVDGAVTVVELNLDQDAAPEMAIHLDQALQLRASDFLL